MVKVVWNEESKFNLFRSDGSMYIRQQVKDDFMMRVKSYSQAWRWVSDDIDFFYCDELIFSESEW